MGERTEPVTSQSAIEFLRGVGHTYGAWGGYILPLRLDVDALTPKDKTQTPGASGFSPTIGRFWTGFKLVAVAVFTAIVVRHIPIGGAADVVLAAIESIGGTVAILSCHVANERTRKGQVANEARARQMEQRENGREKALETAVRELGTILKGATADNLAQVKNRVQAQLVEIDRQIASPLVPQRTVNHRVNDVVRHRLNALQSLRVIDDPFSIGSMALGAIIHGVATYVFHLPPDIAFNIGVGVSLGGRAVANLAAVPLAADSVDRTTETLQTKAHEQRLAFDGQSTLPDGNEVLRRISVAQLAVEQERGLSFGQSTGAEQLQIPEQLRNDHHLLY